MALVDQVAALATRVANEFKAHHTIVTQSSGTATVTLNAALGDRRAITATGNITLAALTNPTDGQMVTVEIYASGGTRTVTISGTTSNATQRVLPATVASGTIAILGFYYSSRAGHWVLASFVTE